MNDRQRRRIIVACAVTVGLCLCVTLAVIIMVGYQLGHQQARRVEAAVRATMGRPYCDGPDARMIVYPTNALVPVGAPVFPANEWSVFCMTEKTDTPIITVNVERCEARVSTPFREAYTQTLAMCP